MMLGDEHKTWTTTDYELAMLMSRRLIEWRDARQAIFDMPAPEKGEPGGAMAPLFARLANAENALMTLARRIL